MLRFFSLLFLSVFISSLAFANTIGDHKKSKPSKKAYQGYVVLNQGDTIKGKIEMLSPSLNEVKVKLFKEDGQFVLYKAKELNSYAFIVPSFNKSRKQYNKQWIYYVKKKVKRPPVPFGPTEVLMQQEVSGEISYYNYYVETRSRMTDFDHLVLLEKEDEMIEVTKRNYKKVLKKMMKDYPPVANKIGKKGYRFKNLDILITMYNTNKPRMKESTPNITSL